MVALTDEVIRGLIEQARKHQIFQVVLPAGHYGLVCKTCDEVIVPNGIGTHRLYVLATLMVEHCRAGGPQSAGVGSRSVTLTEVEWRAILKMLPVDPVWRPAEDCRALDKLKAQVQNLSVEIEDVPIPMRIPCPRCGVLHVDKGEYATKPHHTHACQSCGEVWRPALVATVGVQFLPGFKDGECGVDG